MATRAARAPWVGVWLPEATSCDTPWPTKALKMLLSKGRCVPTVASLPVGLGAQCSPGLATLGLGAWLSLPTSTVGFSK